MFGVLLVKKIVSNELGSLDPEKKTFFPGIRSYEGAFFKKLRLRLNFTMRLKNSAEIEIKSCFEIKVEIKI